MDSRVVYIPQADVLEHVKNMIAQGKSVTIRATGNSMLPTIRHQDRVEISPLERVEKYDIVLARLPRGGYVVHRVVRIDGNNITLMGDGNIINTESCKVSDILGVVTMCFRGRLRLRTDSNIWRLYVVFWVAIRPFRRYLLAIYRRVFKYSIYENQ